MLPELLQYLTRFIQNLRKITGKKILTPEGYKSFEGIQKVVKPAYKFTFDNGLELIIGKGHVFICDGLEIFASSLNPGNTIIGA
jgi:hypothetical protein